MGPLGRLELTVYPVGKRQQESCTAAPDMIVCRQEVQCPARLFHGTGSIAERLGAKGAGEGDRPRQRPELLRVRNHHPDRRGPSRPVARVDRAARSARRLAKGCLKPPLGIAQAGRRGIHLTHPQQGEGVVCAEHRSRADQIVRYDFEPLEQPG